MAESIEEHMIPVFIICRNRVTYARQILEQVKGLEGAIPVIIDNDSTWPSMNNWVYDLILEPGQRVIRLNKNLGCYAVWSKMEVDICLGQFSINLLEETYSTNIYNYVVTDRKSVV